MTKPFTLFEISWEVCNKVGGIHTVLSTKAKCLTERFGDRYVAVGPWLLSDEERDIPFDEDDGYDEFVESCREMGLPVRVGRWRVPGTPLTILVEFSQLYDEKDTVLSELWEHYSVDSISGEWDYVEPVLFGWAAGRVIEKWWREFVGPAHHRAVVQAHEWMTGSSLLYLKRHVPSIGTVFTTHATMLGRALSSLGQSPDDGLAGRTAADLAEENNVVAKHSIEGICAREADTFTTVSQITAKEAELLHERAPEPILPNGIDLEVIDEIAGDHQRDEVRTKLLHMSSRFFGEDVSDAAFFCISGRYEFHNKGIDLLLDALETMNHEEGRQVLLFILVPAGNSGLKSELLERLEGNGEDLDGAVGLSTHNLFEPDHDPVHEHCARIGLGNAPDDRIKVMQVPVYLSENDGFLDFPYEAVLRAMDLSCFPSFYEPWGYTPQESLAVGVPTFTTDYAGFGRWALETGLGAENGITVLPRKDKTYDEVRAELAEHLEAFLKSGPGAGEIRQACRDAARLTSWSDLLVHYDRAWDLALENAFDRLGQGAGVSRRPRKVLSVKAPVEGHEPNLHTFDVSATLPATLVGLRRLARNYWWSWDPEATALFEELSPLSWAACDHNPVRFLKRVFADDLKKKADDEDYVQRLESVLERFDAYMDQPAEAGEWTAASPEADALSADRPVAYFCAEFGIHESLRIYSGGHGVLAGDHLKSASDIGLPLVAVGLFYRKGYMGQRLSPSAEQVEVDVENDPRDLPLERVLGADNEPLEIKLLLPGRHLHLAAWKVRVGRVTLYLLDSNLPQNRQEDRQITRNLYGGDEETRLLQEIVLGRGGVRLLRTLQISPSVCHMNEGHAAFLTLERVGQLAHKEGLTFGEAREFIRATTLFTTHTPVPAGHDRFGEDLLRRYFSDVADRVGIPWEQFFALGQTDEDDDSFNMTYLAMNFSSCVNGVSKLHGVASRSLLRPFWPNLVESEVPVESVTNGIHLATWTAPQIASALEVTGRGARAQDFDREYDDAQLADLWDVRKELKRRLIERAGASLRESFLGRGDSPVLLEQMLDGLSEDALLVGFARRFAPYKRAHLIFQDRARLRALLEDSDRPIRLLVAGKAHPRDQMGKDILKGIAEIARDDEFVGRVFFLENYEIDLARFLVQGVDVWLNNPTRMMEASGTSGMKASANGALNLSIGDGWWPEAYDGTNGWLIADARVYEDQTLQDQFDASILYRLLEEELLPLYFDRNGAGVPTGWMEKVARNLLTVPPQFNTDRMVLDYTRLAYGPLGAADRELTQERKWRVKALTAEKQRIRRGFKAVKVKSATMAELDQVKVGDPLDVRVEVVLGDLSHEDVRVEWVLGHDAGNGDLLNPIEVPLAYVGHGDGECHVFEGSHKMERSGSYACGLRVRPNPEKDPGGSLLDLLLWA